MSVSDVEKAFGQIEEVEAVVSTIGGTPANPKADSEVRIKHCKARTARKESGKSSLRVLGHSFW